MEGRARSSIRQCDLVVTENCMLRCKMCHMWKHTKNDDQIDIREYESFFSHFRQLGGDNLQIQFVGGEPLLKKRISELIQMASQKGISTTMTTNGFLLDEKTADSIIKSGLNTLGFSLESLKEEKHDFLRGTSGVYKKIMKAINYLGKYPGRIPLLFISTIISGYNLDDLVELAGWVNNHEKLDFIYFQAVMQPFAMPDDDNWYRKEECAFLWPQPDSVNAALDSLSQLKRNGYKIGNPKGQFAAFKKYFNNPHQFIKKTKCNLGYESFTVLPNGDIFLCLSLPPIGNIKTNDINEFWYSQKADAVRQQIADCSRNCKLMINCFFEDENAAKQ